MQTTYAAEAAVISYGAHIAKVRVDMEMGKNGASRLCRRPRRGKAINPMGVHGAARRRYPDGRGVCAERRIELDEKGKVKKQ